MLLFRQFGDPGGGKLLVCAADDGVTCLLPLCLPAGGISFARVGFSVDVVELLVRLFRFLVLNDRCVVALLFCWSCAG